MRVKFLYFMPTSNTTLIFISVSLNANVTSEDNITLSNHARSIHI